jgi:hypothetical protein
LSPQREEWIVKPFLEAASKFDRQIVTMLEAGTAQERIYVYTVPTDPVPNTKILGAMAFV